ncbi:ribonuclease P protein subunit p40-like [Bicyclus anynana]|uniref:Ribonuclease P protein subunit p40-like n=1 Tax=Bicyclus anynana TaxID=110368 RepID=A0A6J1MYK7_BICAN|nr:ribonuclease P protein subunit p40-like [Bicyclus anynana]
MLCPEIWDFPSPKVVCSNKKCLTLNSVSKIVELNNFYRNVIITCPDELHTPRFIEDSLLDDSDYYEVANCPLTEFIDPVFIQKFIKTGKLYCLTANTNCMIQNCAALTPDGILTLHILESTYQTLGIEGTKRPHKFYQIEIPLKDLKNISRVKTALEKLKLFDFNISWVPEIENVCPSSIAKYFCNKNYKVSSHSMSIERVAPVIKEVPTIHNSDIDEVVEWIGMLAHDANLTPTESYVSTYAEPECSTPIKTSRISIIIVKGFLTPNILINTSKLLEDYVKSRDFKHYWACLSVQSIEESLWQWNTSSPRIFQSQNASCNIFFTQESHSVYTVGQLKYT